MSRSRRLKANEVFTPGSFPEHTYVERSEAGNESALKHALSTPGVIVSISGPSKSGKTVLVEKVVGPEALVVVTGSDTVQPADLWERTLDRLGVPSEENRSSSSSTDASVGVGGGTLGVGRRKSRSTGTSKQRRGLQQLTEIFTKEGKFLLIDDFHYMGVASRKNVAKEIKEAARRGMSFLIASVPHRAGDVVRANRELRGRLMSIDIEYWDIDDLILIGERGFALLNTKVDQSTLQMFAKESGGSPQLMQAICLSACQSCEIDATPHKERVISEDKIELSLHNTSRLADYRDLARKLNSGPVTRGRERISYPMTDGREGDVYQCILKAISIDPPKQLFSYSDLLDRVARVCLNEKPSGSSIKGSCKHLDTIATEHDGQEAVTVSWDSEQGLVIGDPYFAFYLRWSDFLGE